MNSKKQAAKLVDAANFAGPKIKRHIPVPELLAMSLLIVSPSATIITRLEDDLEAGKTIDITTPEDKHLRICHYEKENCSRLKFYRSGELYSQVDILTTFEGEVSTVALLVGCEIIHLTRHLSYLL